MKVCSYDSYNPQTVDLNENHPDFIVGDMCQQKCDSGMARRQEPTVADVGTPFHVHQLSHHCI